MYKKHVRLNIKLLCLVFTTIFLLNFIVDPYNYNNFFQLDLDKKNISYKKNYRLYKMIEFRNNPKNFIILGDSRGNLFKSEFFKNNNVYNFSYGGASLYELIDTFWYATKNEQLKNVIFTLPFSMYNEYEYINYTEEAQLFIDKPHKYYFSLFITKISLLNIYASLLNKKMNFEKPNMNKLNFWKEQLHIANRFYTKYKYPSELFLKLQEIVEYSKTNNINLSFVIPPTHIDLQNKIKTFNFVDKYSKYKKDILSLGTTFDCNINSKITNDIDSFNDPFHFTSGVAENIVAVISQKNESNDICHKYINRNPL